MDAPPHLLILSFSPISQDARVLKQVRHFAARYTVTTCGYGSAPDGVAQHLEIPSELQAWRFNRVALILRLYRLAYWRNSAVAYAASSLRGMQFDAILANDIDTVPLALSLRSRTGVHADLHEFAARQKEEVRRWRMFAAPFMRWLTRAYVSRSESVTTVSAGLARAFGSEFGIDAGVVTNAAPYADLTPQPTSRNLRLVHSGACFRNRELMTMIDAVEATDASVTLDMYLTPNDPGYLRELEERASGVTGVTIHAPVPYEQLIATLNQFDVGLFVLPPLNFNHEWALPNKLFDYLQARLSVVIGPSAEMAHYVEEYRFGVVAEGFSVAALASAISGLTPASVGEMKRNAHAAAKELSADAQVAIWDDAIARLITR